MGTKDEKTKDERNAGGVHTRGSAPPTFGLHPPAASLVSQKLLNGKNHNDIEWRADVEPMVERFLRRKKKPQYDKLASLVNDPTSDTAGTRPLSNDYGFTALNYRLSPL